MVSAVVDLMDPVAAFLSGLFIEILIVLRRNFRSQRNKKFIINMFSSSKSKEINTFFKKNKISPRDDEELSKLFLEFYSDLII